MDDRKRRTRRSRRSRAEGWSRFDIRIRRSARREMLCVPRAVPVDRMVFGVGAR